MNMRKHTLLFTLLLTLALILCAHAALAQSGLEHLESQGASAVPADRVVFKAPTSLKYTTGSKHSVGDFIVTIDQQDTQWLELISECGQSAPMGTMLSLYEPYGFYVKPPEDAVTYQYANLKMGGGPDPNPIPSFDEQFAIDAEKVFNQPMYSGNSDASGVYLKLFPPNPIMFGKFDVQTGVYTHQLNHWLGAPYYLALFCWTDGNNNKTYEYLVYSLQAEDTSAFTVEYPALKSSEMIPCANLIPEQIEQITVITANNSVTYKLSAPDALGSATQIKTGIDLAGDADANWICEIGSETYTADQLKAGIPMDIPAEAGSVTSKTLTLIWKDGSNFKAARTLTIAIEFADPAPFPTRVSDWTPIPQSRMRVEVTNQYDGLAFSYDAKTDAGGKLGMLQVDIDPAKLPDDMPLDSACYNAYIIPPDGAVQFSVSCNNPGAPNPLYVHQNLNNIYDYSSSSPQEIEATLARAPKLNIQDFLVPSGMQLFWDNTKFMSSSTLKLPNGRSLYLYSANGANGTPYSGSVALFQWYDKDGNLLKGENGKPLKEYYMLRGASPVSFTTSTAAKSLDELKKQDQRYPRLYIQQGANNGETYYLYFHVMPKSNASANASDNAKELVYEMYMTDSEGNKLTKEKIKGLNVSVYLPYPEGVTFNTVSDYLVSVSHLEAGREEYSITETFDGSKLEFTPDGIRFTATSFSPYVLSYEPAHVLTTTAAGAVITQKCTCGDTATAEISTKETYVSGEKVEASVTVTETWQGVTPVVSYYDANGKKLTKAPTAPGSYSAAIESDGARAERFFTIVVLPQQSLPQTGDPSQPLMLLTLAALSVLGMTLTLRKKHA